VLFGVPGSTGAYKWDRFPARSIITPETAKVPRSIHQNILRRYEVRYDYDFEAVVAGCQGGRSGWLTPAAIDIYREVHARGFIATVETYRDGVLVGGVWGIDVGRTLGLMSAFHLENHAGSVAWASLANIVASRGRWTLIDCGVPGNPHYERFGATGVPIEKLCELILEGLALPRATIT
jgi:leucyl/phenylalanyl-tRNA--protein transferase